jgi:hypothetical protein
MDFTLVVCSLALTFALGAMRVGKTVSAVSKTTKVIHHLLIKQSINILNFYLQSQRAIRILKGLRSFKACRILTASTASFMRIKSMIRKAVLCLPGGNILIHFSFYIFSQEIGRSFVFLLLYLHYDWNRDFR